MEIIETIYFANKCLSSEDIGLKRPIRIGISCKMVGPLPKDQVINYFNLLREPDKFS